MIRIADGAYHEHHTAKESVVIDKVSSFSLAIVSAKLSWNIMSEITRAISIRQPFVELILQRKKGWEYRSTPTKITERVYLYASKKPVDDDASWRKAGYEKGTLPTGVIIGSVVIAGCEWFEKYGCYRYKLKSPKRFRKPLKPKSQPQPKFFRPRV